MKFPIQGAFFIFNIYQSIELLLKTPCYFTQNHVYL